MKITSTLKTLIRNVVVNVMFISSSSLLFAADNNSSLDKTTSKELWTLFDDVYHNMQVQMEEHSDTNLINTILDRECMIDWNNQSQVNALLADADSLDANNGLSVRGGYTTSNLGDSGNDDDGNSYVELSWEVLRSGYKDYASQAKNIRRDAEIKQLEGELKELTLDYRCRKHHLTSQFLALESSLISLKLSLMEPVYQIEKKAYFSGWSFLDELLVSEQDLQMARQQLTYLSSNPYLHDPQMVNINPPVIDVNIMAIIASIKNDKRLERIGTLQKKNIEQKSEYKDGSKVRVFLRKEFASNEFNNDGVVAGVRFSVPLSGSDNKSYTYQTKQIDQENSYAKWDRITKTHSAYEQLHEQLNKVLRLQFSYLKSKERVRRIKAHRSLNDELNLAAVIARMRTFLDTGIDLIKAKKELYRRVNNIFLVSGIKYDERFIKISPIKQIDYRARPGNREIYLWSKRFNSMSNNQIISFLNTKDIKRVLLSAGKNTDKRKMKDFIALANQNAIDVEPIIGSNNWITPSNHTKAAVAFANFSESSKKIHLDIEPQAMSGNKKEHLENYLNLLSSLRESNKEQFISVAVPFHWSTEAYLKVNALTDKLYLMAYGTNKVETIIRRVKNILNTVPQNKVVVVLNIKDFDNEWAMEKVIESLQESVGLTAFAFHNLDTFIKQQGE